MKVITNLSNYLEEYSIYYLSRYSVSEKKFEYILLNKIKKDLLKGKINKLQQNQCKEIIKNIICKFTNKKIINEEYLIESRISSLVKKGMSFKKIKFILKKDKFKDSLITTNLNILKSDSNINNKLIDNYCSKKRLGKYSSSWNSVSEELHNRTMAKLLRQGFDYKLCQSFLKWKHD